MSLILSKTIKYPEIYSSTVITYIYSNTLHLCSSQSVFSPLSALESAFLTLTVTSSGQERKQISIFPQKNRSADLADLWKCCAQDVLSLRNRISSPG